MEESLSGPFSVARPARVSCRGGPAAWPELADCGDADADTDDAGGVGEGEEVGIRSVLRHRRRRRRSGGLDVRQGRPGRTGECPGVRRRHRHRRLRGRGPVPDRRLLRLTCRC